MILEVGALASHFTLLGIDGREYSLPGSLGGRPAVLVFFKTSCGTCDVAFPYINGLREAYPGDSWRLWAVSQDPPGRSIDYAQRQGVTYPVLLDAPAFVVSKLYDPAATPTLFLVDGAGRVAYSTHGFVKADINELSRLLAAEIGEEPVVVAAAGDGRPDFKPG